MATAVARILEGCTALLLTREQQRKYAEEVSQVSIRELLAERDLSPQANFRRNIAMSASKSSATKTPKTHAELEADLKDLLTRRGNVRGEGFHEKMIRLDFDKQIHAIQSLLGRKEMVPKKEPSSKFITV